MVMARDNGHVSTDKLQHTFGQDPGLCKRALPRNPAALFTDLAGEPERATGQVAA